MSTPPVYIDYLNRFDIEDLGFTDTELLDSIEHSVPGSRGISTS